jgi:hypothetical protein
MVGPLPEITAPVGDEVTDLPGVPDEVVATIDAPGSSPGGPVTLDAPASGLADFEASSGATSPSVDERETAPSRVEGPPPLDGREGGPDAPVALDAPDAPHAPRNERVVLDELEAWLKALKR